MYRRQRAHLCVGVSRVPVGVSVSTCRSLFVLQRVVEHVVMKNKAYLEGCLDFITMCKTVSAKWKCDHAR